jgi:hypothetical protein
MKPRAALVLACVGAPLLLAGAVASCGARTGLSITPETDAGQEASVIRDRFVPTEEEAMPPIDAFKNDVQVVNPCPDAAATLIYAIGESNVLYSFTPPNGPFTPIGTIECPGTDSTITPFSMAVDRSGVAYVVFSNQMTSKAAGLYRVSTKTAQCTPTSYDPGKNGGETFGMGFVANVGDGGDAGETLFVSEDLGTNGAGNGVLATIDTETFLLTSIGPYSPVVSNAELTGTGDGRLFAFSPATTAANTFIAQIDPTNATVIGKDPVPGVVQGAGWAFGFWGGDFYTFTTPSETDRMTEVHRFNPVDKSVTLVTSINDNIVGAGVSTCAPQN